MQVPGLADDGDDRGLGFDEGLHAGVVGRVPALSASHTKGRDLGVAQFQLADFLKILKVLWVRERIAAFNEVDAQLIEATRNEQLVLKRKVDTLALAAVAKRRVVDLNACHSKPAIKKPEALCSGAGNSTW